MKTLFCIAKGFFLVCFLLQTIAYAEVASEDSTGRDDTKIYHLYGDIDLFANLKISYARPRIVIKTVFPQLQNSSFLKISEDNENEDVGFDDPRNDTIDGFNESAQDIIQYEIAMYKKLVMQSQSLQKHIPVKQIRNNLYIDYDASVIKAPKIHLISIRFNIQGDISGTNQPYHYHRVLNYDLDNNKKIELSDLFLTEVNYLEYLSDFSHSTLSQRLSNISRVADGTGAKSNNFNNWNIKPRGLLITFDPGQVASRVQGTQTVLIPYAKLRKIISPDSPLFICVKYRNRCLRNNLLTGGFLDEAVNTRHRHFDPIFSQL